MKKFSLILVVLFSLMLISSVVLAEETNGEDNEVDDTVIDVTQAFEEESDEDILPEDEPTPIKPYIRTLLFSGNGIASNPSDAMDFFIVKVIGGKVALADRTIIGKGILYLDKEKYRLEDLQIDGITAKAKIVGGENMLADVGELSLTKVVKPSIDVWAGTMTLNSKTYNFYLLSKHRLFKAVEVAEKARNYCQEHPYDESCKAVAGYLCKDDTEDCKMKVFSYCEDHADDSRCKNIVRSYCAGNLIDGRCRETVQEYCNGNPNAEYCKNEVVDFCKENPENDRCKNIVSSYCEKNPRDKKCIGEGLRECKLNPGAGDCARIIKEYCEYNQDSELCGNVKLSYCEQYPESERCIATATSLCELDRFKDSEKCNSIQETARKRIQTVVATAVRKIDKAVNSGVIK